MLIYSQFTQFPSVLLLTALTVTSSTFFFLLFWEVVWPWSFSALHNLFDHHPAERILTWLGANPLKTFKAVGANPSVPTTSLWHCSSLVSELTLQLCSHEMWRLLKDQRCCLCALALLALLQFDWHLTGKTLGALLLFDWRGNCHIPSPINQCPPVNPLKSQRGSAAGSWISAPALCSLKTAVCGTRLVVWIWPWWLSA